MFGPKRETPALPQVSLCISYWGLSVPFGVTFPFCRVVVLGPLRTRRRGVSPEVSVSLGCTRGSETGGRDPGTFPWSSGSHVHVAGCSRVFTGEGRTKVVEGETGCSRRASSSWLCGCPVVYSFESVGRRGARRLRESDPLISPLHTVLETVTVLRD